MTLNCPPEGHEVLGCAPAFPPEHDAEELRRGFSDGAPFQSYETIDQVNIDNPVPETVFLDLRQVWKPRLNWFPFASHVSCEMTFMHKLGLTLFCIEMSWPAFDVSTTLSHRPVRTAVSSLKMTNLPRAPRAALTTR